MEYFYSLILTYKYAILLPIAIVEGPMITVIASFMASQGFLNIYAVYMIAVLGNLIGDTIYYSLGRIGRYTFITKYGKYIGITDARVKFIEEHYKNNLLKTIFFSKMINAGIEIFLVTAGIAKVDFRKYISIIILIEIPKNILIVLVGYYFGASYVAINNYFHNPIIEISFVLLIGALIFFILRQLKKIKTEI